MVLIGVNYDTPYVLRIGELELDNVEVSSVCFVCFPRSTDTSGIKNLFVLFVPPIVSTPQASRKRGYYTSSPVLLVTTRKKNHVSPIIFSIQPFFHRHSRYRADNYAKLHVALALY